MDTIAPAQERRRWTLDPKIAFLLVSFSLGELGDGLNIFQGIYLVGVGWNEGSVGVALSLMGLTALIVQPWAGDWVDKTTVDRRVFLSIAGVVTALSASAILLVRQGNVDHALIFISKVIEGVAASFIAPCLAALTLASFGPAQFDKIMASNILWGHIGSVVAAVLAGGVAFILYPNVKYCFLIIGASALLALIFVPHLPVGDRLLGRGFERKPVLNENGDIVIVEDPAVDDKKEEEETPQADTYLETFMNPKTRLLCLTGFFFQYVLTVYAHCVRVCSPQCLV